MANTKSAGKRARQTELRTLRNRSVLTRLRRMTKKTANQAASDVTSLISAIDKAAKRGIIHRNAANRRKARLKKALGRSSAPSSMPSQSA
jgi:small subunit ribosomal protein S20